MRHFSRKVRGLDGLTQAQREYREYLASPLWRAKRQEALDAHGNVCEYCGAKGSCDVHHKRYPSVLGEELLRDLQPLCRNCHKSLHSAMRGGKRRKKKWFRA